MYVQNAVWHCVLCCLLKSNAYRPSSDTTHTRKRNSHNWSASFLLVTDIFFWGSADLRNRTKRYAEKIFRLFCLIFYILWTTKERTHSTIDKIIHVS